MTETKSPKWRKNAYLFLIGQGLTMFGTMMVHYAITWHVTLQTNSSTVIALFSIAMALPMFFISPFGGVWADRHNRKLLINISDGAIAVVTLVMAILYANGVQSLGLLLCCIIVRSIGQGIQTPASSSLIPQIVPSEHLAKFNGLQGTVQSIVMLVAPMAGGAVLSFAPIYVVMMIDVVTAIIGILMLVFTVTVPNPTKQKTQQPSYFSDIKAGISYIKGNKMLVAFLGFNVFFNLLIVPLSVMTPLHVARVWGDAYWMLTVNESVFFAGMMLGGAVIAIWGGFKNKSRTMSLSNAWLGLTSILMGITDNFLIYSIFMGLCGISLPLFNAPMMTIMQTKVAPEFMGRVFAVSTMISTLAMPVGSVIFAPLGEVGRVPIGVLLIITGALILLSSPFFVLNKVMRQAGESVSEKEANVNE
jgi:DHA3 family macrolide efflux protein-like MFS transporter